MSEITTVVLDAMGGDNAPAAMIDGAIDAISKEKNVKVILVGIEDVIRKGLEGKTYNPEQIEIVNATAPKAVRGSHFVRKAVLFWKAFNDIGSVPIKLTCFCAS